MHTLKAHQKEWSTWKVQINLDVSFIPLPLSHTLLPRRLSCYINFLCIHRLCLPLSLFQLNGWGCMYWHNSSSSTQQCEGSAVQLGVSLMIRLMRVAGIQTCLRELLQEGEEKRGNVRRGTEREEEERKWTLGDGKERKGKERKGKERKQNEMKHRLNHWPITNVPTMHAFLLSACGLFYWTIEGT